MVPVKKSFGSFYALAAGTLWGSMGVFVRHFQTIGLNALEIGWFRVLFGLLVVGLYLALRHRELLKIRFRDVPLFVGTGVGSLFLLNLTYYTSMRYVSLAVAGVLLYTAPIFVMLLSAILFREKITPKKLLALGLAFLGCAMVSGLGGSNQISLPGVLWGLGAGLSYCMYSIIGRYILRRGYSSWTMTFYTFVFCMLADCLVCDWQAVGNIFLQPGELLWAAGLGVVTAFFPYVFYSKALEHMEGSRASILASIEPVVAALFSVFLFHEPLGMAGVAGMVLVLAAIVLLSVSPARKHSLS